MEAQERNMQILYHRACFCKEGMPCIWEEKCSKCKRRNHFEACCKSEPQRTERPKSNKKKINKVANEQTLSNLESEEE